LIIKKKKGVAFLERMKNMFDILELKVEEFRENEEIKAYYAAIYLHQRLIEHTNFSPYSCKKTVETRIKRIFKLIELKAPFILIQNELRQIKEYLQWQNISF